MHHYRKQEQSWQMLEVIQDMRKLRLTFKLLEVLKNICYHMFRKKLEKFISLLILNL